MSLERTLSIIKPDAISRKLEGAIISKIEENGFNIITQKKVWLTKRQVALFYREHSAKPFFEDLINFMSSGPVVVQVLEKENAVIDYRTLMGATNPNDAAEGTLRKLFAVDTTKNSVHGSDNIESAFRETHFFFSGIEMDR